MTKIIPQDKRQYELLFDTILNEKKQAQPGAITMMKNHLHGAGGGGGGPECMMMMGDRMEAMDYKIGSCVQRKMRKCDRRKEKEEEEEEE